MLGYLATSRNCALSLLFPSLQLSFDWQVGVVMTGVLVGRGELMQMRATLCPPSLYNSVSFSHPSS